MTVYKDDERLGRYLGRYLKLPLDFTLFIRTYIDILNDIYQRAREAPRWPLAAARTAQEPRPSATFCSWPPCCCCQPAERAAEQTCGLSCPLVFGYALPARRPLRRARRGRTAALTICSGLHCAGCRCCRSRTTPGCHGRRCLRTHAQHSHAMWCASHAAVRSTRASVGGIAATARRPVGGRAPTTPLGGQRWKPV